MVYSDPNAQEKITGEVSDRCCEGISESEGERERAEESAVRKDGEEGKGGNERETKTHSEQREFPRRVQ